VDSGVYRARPPQALVERIDQLLGAARPRHESAA
jgi:hypothetical protein